MTKLKKITIPFLIFILFFTSLFWVRSSYSQSETEKKAQELQQKIDEYTKKLEQISQQKNTLSSQIQYMNTQISLTTLQIQNTETKIIQTEKEIEKLSEKIEKLNTSLDFLTKVLLNKIVEGYKRRQLSFFNIFLDSENASILTNRLKYIKIVQEKDRRFAVQVQQAKVNFEEQKILREEKKKQLDDLKVTLEGQKNKLSSQKSAMQKLLEITKNDEKVYQELLTKARAEYAAIQAIVAGAGTETKLQEVKNGETIATLIPGASCNSSSEHLHFIIQENGKVINPLDRLKPVDYKNCSGSSCDSGDGDPVNPSGSWDWPLNSPIKIHQGYGSTWAIKNTWVGRIYNFHNGIDITGSSAEVKAVADGTLYRGSYSVGCPLLYVKLVHKDSNTTTLYLHVYSK